MGFFLKQVTAVYRSINSMSFTYLQNLFMYSPHRVTGPCLWARQLQYDSFSQCAVPCNTCDTAERGAGSSSFSVSVFQLCWNEGWKMTKGWGNLFTCLVVQSSVQCVWRRHRTAVRKGREMRTALRTSSAADTVYVLAPCPSWLTDLLHNTVQLSGVYMYHLLSHEGTFASDGIVCWCFFCDTIDSYYFNQETLNYWSLLRRCSVSCLRLELILKYRVIQKELHTFKNLFVRNWRLYGHLMRICQRPRGLTTLPRSLEEMKEIVVAAMSTIDGDMLQGAWDKSIYRINMWVL
jgi:hypothetical protein